MELKKYRPNCWHDHRKQVLFWNLEISIIMLNISIDSNFYWICGHSFDLGNRNCENLEFITSNRVQTSKLTEKLLWYSFSHLHIIC